MPFNPNLVPKLRGTPFFKIWPKFLAYITCIYLRYLHSNGKSKVKLKPPLFMLWYHHQTLCQNHCHFVSSNQTPSPRIFQYFSTLSQNALFESDTKWHTHMKKKVNSNHICSIKIWKHHCSLPLSPLNMEHSHITQIPSHR